MSDRFLFVDFDDTLVNHDAHRTQYRLAIGGELAPKYGGAVEDWALASKVMFQAVEKQYLARFVGNPLNGYCEWLETMYAFSIEETFRNMKLPLPPEAAKLAEEVQFDALINCNAVFPGTVAAMMQLDEEGYRIQIASANDSRFLLPALMASQEEGYSLENYTGSKFGPDLVDCAKEGPEFYQRIFAASDADPVFTLVVDDHPQVIAWAKQAGAKTIQSRLLLPHRFPLSEHADAELTEMRELPQLVKQLLG